MNSTKGIGIDNPSLQVSLLPDNDPRREEDKIDSLGKGPLGNISFVSDHESKSNRNRGYRPPGVPDDFVSQGAASTGRTSPMVPAPTQKNKGIQLSSSSPAKTSSLQVSKKEIDLSLSGKENEEEVATKKEAVEIASYYLKNQNESGARTSIITALKTVDRFTRASENKLQEEVEKILTATREKTMNEARQKAYDLLNADPNSQQSEQRALVILKEAIRQAIPQKEYDKKLEEARVAAQANPDAPFIGDLTAYFNKQAEEMLTEIRAIV